MNSNQIEGNFGVPIGVVERETGLSRDALRKWELRYGFPLPGRDANGERSYSSAQLAHLRLVKRLMDRGLRPGKLLPLATARLQELAAACTEPQSEDGLVTAVFAALNMHDPEALQRALGQSLMQAGLGEFVQARLPLVNERIGEAWASGRLSVHQEHLYAEILQTLLREATARLPASADGPRLLLATLPGELHTLGLLMVQAQFTLMGARCISLGAQVPIGELLAAAGAYKIQVLGLSFSIAYPVRRIAPLLKELHRGLDPAVQIWVGGRGIHRARAIPDGVRVLLKLSDAMSALAALQPPTLPR